MKRGLRRRRILVHPLQYRLLLTDAIHFATILAIFAALVFGPLAFQLKNGVLSLPQREQAANEFLSLHMRLWPALVPVLVLLALHSILTSHRIAGPLYRFHRVWEAISAGDLSVNANIRKNDYLGGDAAIVNAMIVALRSRVKAIEDEVSAMQKAVGDLGSAIDGGSTPAIHASFESLAARVDTLRACLGQFSLTPRESPAGEGRLQPGRPGISGGPLDLPTP